MRAWQLRRGQIPKGAYPSVYLDAGLYKGPGLAKAAHGSLQVCRGGYTQVLKGAPRRA